MACLSKISFAVLPLLDWLGWLASAFCTAADVDKEAVGNPSLRRCHDVTCCPRLPVTGDPKRVTCHWPFFVMVSRHLVMLAMLLKARQV